MKANSYTRCLASGLLVLIGSLVASPQRATPPLPMIAGAAVPVYPPRAHQANVQGVVHVRVSTDGHRVIDARAEDGHRVLAEAAVENSKTWVFATHDPTTLTLTYRYKLVEGLDTYPNNPIVVFRFPKEVEISMKPWPVHPTRPYPPTP